MTTATKTKPAGNGKQATAPQAEQPEAAASAQKATAAEKAAAPAAGFGAIPVLKDLPSYEEVLQFNRETLDALLQAGNAATKGYQDLSRAWLGLAQESVEDAVNAGKALAGARTLKEMLDVQANLTRTSLEKAVVESGRLQEMSMRLAEATLAPLNSCLTAVIERWGKTAA